jgi:hypothetical protein
MEEMWPVLKWIALLVLLITPYFIWQNYAYPPMTDAEVMESMTVVRMISSDTDADGNKNIVYVISNNNKALNAPARMTIGCIAGSSNGSSVMLMHGVYHGEYAIDEDRAIPPLTVVNVDFNGDGVDGHDLRPGEYLTAQCIVGARWDDERIVHRMTQQ